MFHYECYVIRGHNAVVLCFIVEFYGFKLKFQVINYCHIMGYKSTNSTAEIIFINSIIFEAKWVKISKHLMHVYLKQYINGTSHGFTYSIPFFES